LGGGREQRGGDELIGLVVVVRPLTSHLMERATLRTARLQLRSVRAEDIDRILEYRNLPEVTRWLLSTEVDPGAFRAAWRRGAQDPDDHSMAVTLDGVVIGTVSLDVVDGMGQPGMPPRTEAHLGYTFDPAYGGHGYATEAVAAMVAHAFDRLGIRRITAGCFADNLASVRVLEKLGMRREQHGVGDSWHAELGWLDGYTYALLAEARRHATATGVQSQAVGSDARAVNP
jgi:RimJ/RimL family protein N-acetyltransferase